MADTTSEDIVDVAFRLHGGRLPVDHAYALFNAVSGALPWFEGEAVARLHRVHTAATGSGWIRPGGSPDDELHLSRRTRLRLRVPQRRAGDTLELSGSTMDIDGYSLTPEAGKVVPLAPASTLLARYVVCEADEDESRFVQRLEDALRAAGVAGATVLCGQTHRIATPSTVVHTRSVVVTDLDPGGAMSLLRSGFGPAGKLGCGIFVPYKRIG